MQTTRLDHTDHATTHTDDQAQEDRTKAKGRAKERQKEHTTTVTHDSKTTEKERDERAKVRASINCYLCGRPFHTNDHPQSDGEPAILELLNALGRQLPQIKIQTSPQHNHQAQGVVESYHQTRFAQLHEDDQL
eukprot:5889112-Amphidinium_carterae.2